jgi:hypothetical protein
LLAIQGTQQNIELVEMRQKQNWLISKSMCLVSIVVSMVYLLKILVCPFVLVPLAIVLSVLIRYTDSDYPFGIFYIIYNPVMFTCKSRYPGFNMICVLVKADIQGSIWFAYL